MAGVKGRSGGARPNSGPKPKPPPKLGKVESDDALEFLLGVMQNPEADARLRVRAAIAAAQYQHIKRGDGGKKEEQQKAADTAADGRFGVSEAPRLVVNNT